MFKVLRPEPSRIEIEISGKLAADEMKCLLDDFVRESQGIQHGRMRYRVSHFHLPSFGAIKEELSRFSELWKVVRQFDRAAVLADKVWLRKWTDLEGAFIPGLALKAFAPDAGAAAEAWLAQ